MYGGRGMRGMNPRQMKRLMKELKQETLRGVTEVIIRFEDKELVIEEPEVIRMIMGQEIYQITGAARERPRDQSSQPETPPDQQANMKTEVEIRDKDVQVLQEKTGVSQEEAIQALKENGGDLVRALLALRKKK